ncbi:MAG: chromate transporter [Acidobacteriaceae bacterium]|nr:chromate transporter [Acidobacteriaceae bacterium]
MNSSKFREFCGVFLRVGNTTLGGGEPTMIALQRELGERGWLSNERFGLAFAMARITPGTNMLAFCAAAGYYIFGLTGAAAGVLAVTIPSSILVVWLTALCEAGDRVGWLGAAVGTALAAVVGLMAALAVNLAFNQSRGPYRVIGLLIFGGSFVLRTAGLSPLQTLVIAAAAGLLWRTA